MYIDSMTPTLSSGQTKPEWNYVASMTPTPRSGQTKLEWNYMGHTSIVQSSGSGKSRLVDEVAKSIFTIPFNIRARQDDASESFPA